MEPITKLAIRDFQSVASAELDVGGFTVIVGPSNSGKSALVRALKAVARNVNSPAAVRAGAKVFTVAIEAGDLQVSIERGKSSSTYRLSQYSTGTEEVYAKSGRSVPEDVQTALALPVPEGPDLTFSGQLDPPFLLAETGSAVAKVLGDLTNVSKLHAAAREANRRKSEASRVAKLRRDDVAVIRSQITEQYGTLQQERQGVSELRSGLEEVRAHAQATERLAGLLETLSTVVAAERDLMTRIESLPNEARLGELSEAEHAVDRQRRFEELLRQYLTYDQAEDKYADEIEQASIEELKIAEEYQTALLDAGTCPMCGRATA